MKKLLTYIIAATLIFTSGAVITANADTLDSSIIAADNFNKPFIPKPDYLPGPESNQFGEGEDDSSRLFIETLVPRYTVFLIGFIGAFAFLSLVVAGVRFLTAYGSEEAAEKAKKQAIFSVVAFLIALLAYTIVNIIVNIEFPEPANSPEADTSPSASIEVINHNLV